MKYLIFLPITLLSHVAFGGNDYVAMPIAAAALARVTRRNGCFMGYWF